MTNLIRFWFKNARPTALPQSMLPAILAVCMASQQAGFLWEYALLAVAGVITGHLGINLFDDYFDYRKKKSSFRGEMERKGMRARISKCDYLTSGAATMNQLLLACLVFCGLALSVGLIIFLKRGELIFWLALITGLLGFSYSGPPLRLSYRGLGELQIGLMFGPLLMAGVYYSACGALDISLFFVSVPVGLLVANILYTHSIMDLEPDKEVGKTTLAVLLKNKKAMLAVSGLFLLLPYLLVVYGVCARLLPLLYLTVLITLPLAVYLFYLMIIFVKDPRRSFSPRFWMGPLPDWERIEKAGISWFMIRWVLARNLLTFFCFIMIINCFIA